MGGALLSLALAALQATHATYTSEPYGFRIDRPEAWGFYATENQAGAAFAMSMYPHGSAGVPSVTVYVVRADEKKTAESLRDAAIAGYRRVTENDVRTESVRVGETDAPAIAGTVTAASGVRLAMRCAYVPRGEFVYAIAGAWQPDDDAEERDVAESMRSFATFAPAARDREPNADEPRWRELASRCGSELHWAASWSAAAERARAESKLVCVVFESYAGLDLPKTAASGELMDPDVQALLNEGCIVLRMEPEDEAPFRAPSAFGMGPHSFGTAFLFVTPDAKVVRETGIGDASHLADVVREVMLGRGARPTEGDVTDADGARRAERALARGDLDLAWKELEAAEPPRADRARASIRARRRNGEAALRSLHAAAGPLRVAAGAADPELACDLAVDEATILMRMGRHVEARAGFERAAREWPDRERACEAAFWLGAYERLSEGEDVGTDTWRRLVAEHPDDRWAWKAAANLLGEGAFVCGGERLEWPDDAMLAAVARKQAAPLATTELDRAEREARAYLVASQRDDGSWICPTDAFSFSSNLYTTAITAICAESLLSAPPSDAERDAVESALAFTLAGHASGTFAAGADLAGVYSIWGRAYALSFLARCRAEKIGDEERIAATMDELARSIEASQHARGGWPYVYFPGDPKGEGFDPSASFLTAGVVLALLDAREAGTKVSSDSTANALAFLDRMRAPDGSYRYMPDAFEAPNATEHPEAAGRGPVCALALLRGGACELDRVRESLVLFVKHSKGLRAEWHKELCHTGPDGQGAHYLFFDYRFAADAVRALPEKERAPFRAVILEDVLAARFDDGSFEDMPGLGRAYATAMALFTLRALGSG